MTSVAIVGGGPGGLLTARLLERHCPDSIRATLFEASDRLGGKVRTCRFESAPVMYEAGVAEIYDYEAIGTDPLRSLIRELALTTSPTHSNAIVLNGALLRDDNDIGRHHGRRTLAAIENFRRRASTMLPRLDWHRGLEPRDNRHPWAGRTFEQVLSEVADPAARKYFHVATHSDLATEPCLTSGLNGLRKLLGSVPGYGAQYSIEGGMELLPRRLAEGLARTRVEMDAAVVRISHDGRRDDRRRRREERGGYSVHFRQGRTVVERDFDAVVIALPHNWLHTIEWAGERLRRAMTRHIAYFDRPGHYLRISVLFDRPFWRRFVSGSWFMLDAFGGCCVYDEGTRHDAGDYGVLGWLLAGADALALCNADDRTLIRRALESLPDDLHQEAGARVIEGKVHRWAGAVSGQPGGLPLRDRASAHCPDPTRLPGLFLVGDYLFDGTLNGVLQSATTTTELLRPWARRGWPTGVAGKAVLNPASQGA